MSPRLPSSWAGRGLAAPCIRCWPRTPHLGQTVVLDNCSDALWRWQQCLVSQCRSQLSWLKDDFMSFLPARFPGVALGPQADIVNLHYPSRRIVSAASCHLLPGTLTVAWGRALELSRGCSLVPGTSFVALDKMLQHSKPRFFSFCEIRIYVLQSCC